MIGQGSGSFADELERAVRELKASDPESARADASLLLAFASGRSRAWMLANGDVPLDEAQRTHFADLRARRLQGVPVAYLTGSAWFCGREFTVDERALIPRPETEHLAEDAIRFLRERVGPSALDLGTGSGAIACTLAAEVPVARIDATDISAGALAVARSNAERLGLAARVTLYQGDLVEPIAGRRYDVIVANLPYVPSARVASIFEPRVALDGGPDGLDVYRRVMPSLGRMLQPGGLVLLEAAPPTIAALNELVVRAFPRGSTEIAPDYGGRSRYVKVAAPP